MPALADYEERLQQEISIFETLLMGRRAQEVPPIWLKVEERFANLIEAATGVCSLYHYAARHVKHRGRVSVLGLGSGACGNELNGLAPLLEAQGCRMELTCLDVASVVLDEARVEAERQGIEFHGVVQDANTMTLPANRYDVILAYASLHHFLDLDQVAREIDRALAPDGVFVTVDIPTRNGFRMWDETLEMVNSLWAVLPSKFRIAHTGYSEPTLVELRANIDYSASSFECINSEAILPALRARLVEVDFVPAFALARRFFDTQFGPNYDYDLPLDRALFEFIMELDDYNLRRGSLRPETFFGAYEKRSPRVKGTSS